MLILNMFAMSKLILNMYGVYMLIMNMNVVSIVQSLKKVINHSFLHSSRNSLRAAHVFLPLQKKKT